MAAGETAGKVTIDHDSPVPKYSQLREILLDLVETELDEDQSIPSERELSTRFGLQAIDAVHEGDWGKMMALRGTDIVRVPLIEGTRELKTVPLERYTEAEVFFGS